MVKGNSYDLFTAVDLVTRSIYRESAQMITLQKAEVVGSNPTRSIFINLVNYGIGKLDFAKQMALGTTPIKWNVLA